MTSALDAELHLHLLAVAAQAGVAEAGAIAELALAGLAAAMVAIAGPEAAYNALQRRADAVAAVVIERRSGT